MSPTRREPEGEDFAKLVDAAKAGHRSAVNDLLRVLQPDIIRYCRARLGRSHGTYTAADDVAQEVLLAAFHALHTYGDSGERFKAFVFGIAKNKIIDHHRKASREQHAQLDEAPDIADHRPGPELTAMRNEQGGEVGALLHTLTDRQREVLAYRVAVGYSADETATAMSTTPGAVRVTQTRALTNLRNRLPRDGE